MKTGVWPEGVEVPPGRIRPLPQQPAPQHRSRPKGGRHEASFAWENEENQTLTRWVREGQT